MKRVQIDLSLIVPTFNTRDLTMACIAAIRATAHDLRYEVIVVDDCSTDHTSEAIAARFPEVIVLRNEKNLGYGGSANAGFRNARGRFLAVLNSDTEVIDGALREMVAYLESHEEVGAVGPTLLNSDGSLQKSISRHPTVIATTLRLLVPMVILDSRFLRSALQRISGVIHLNAGRLGDQPSKATNVDCIMGAVIVVRREVFEATGGFDAETFFLFAEEADWLLRIQRQGWFVVFLPAARVVHHGGQTVGRLKERYLVQQYKSFYSFHAKHRSPVTVITYVVIMTLVFGLRAAANCVLAACWPSKRTVAMRRAEAFLTIVRLMYDRSLRTRNIREMTFKYIDPLD